MKTKKNVFRCFNPVLALCIMLVFAMLMSGCNDSDDDDNSAETTAWYIDGDGDGYGDPDATIQAETQPDGYVADNTDCNDSSASIHPGAAEVCGDGIDQDCDGSDLICDTTVYYKDADADGYSDGTTLEAVSQPAGYYASGDLVSLSGDCDDTDAGVNPGTSEACNDGIDNDCNGSTDCSDTACMDEASCEANDGSIIYVNVNSSADSPDGTSWRSAYISLADALENATSDQEIWVAQGTYYPSEGTDRTVSLTLLPDVYVYGGFVGDETSRDDRDWESNVTILSGDIGTAGVDTDNSYHVVAGSDDAILDGFTIQDGYADGTDPDNEVLVETTSEHEDDEILRIVTGGKYKVGAGLYNVHAGTVTKNCTFKDNFAAKGAAAYNMVTQYWDGPGNSIIGDAPSFENCTFDSNTASRGGAVANDFATSTTFTNCIFTGNDSDSKGGAIYADMACPIYLINVLFAGNYAERGGALVADGSSSHRGVYVMFVDNSVDDLGAALYQGTYMGITETGTFTGNEVHLYKSVVIGNDSASSSSSISNWHDCSVTFDEDSIVETIDGDLAVSDYLDTTTYESLSWDYGWQEGRDEDTDTWVATFEADGNRTYTTYSYDTDNSSGTTTGMIYVDTDATGVNDGTSWTDAYVSLSDALDTAGSGAEIWVAEGTYTPTSGTDRSETFVMKEDVSIYGGFDGSESTRGARDYSTNTTTLSGDIGTLDDDSDNSYHVLFGATGAVLDGFVIQDGNADGDIGHAFAH